MTRLRGSRQRHVWLLVCVVAVVSAVYVVRQLSHGGQTAGGGATGKVARRGSDS
ncbi:hypothetical protein [Streptomyces sp. NPDC048057]|uniref:hypothetical protein n=1 Tax=Streptomyces sp. NPDC048057 TaxID=3155628 RepID=UPI0033ECE73F